MELRNKYKELWGKLENPSTQPTHSANVIESEYREFKNKVFEQKDAFVEKILQSLYRGDVHILRNAFEKEVLIRLRQGVFDCRVKTSSEFYKMLEGCPNFHRIVDGEVAANYGFKMYRHSFYFFPWNKDPFGLFDRVYDQWSVLKFLGGFKLDEYVGNTPKDGVIDRIHIMQYPSGLGAGEIHTDPYLNQRVIISIFLSKRGVDYSSGGFFVIGADNQKIDMEPQLEVGDMLIAYPTIPHGVEIVDKDASVDWNSIKGRWFMGLYSNDTDYKQNRHTNKPVNIPAV